MSKHTPGPWKAVEYAHSFGICTAKGDGYSERLAECVYWNTPRDDQPSRDTARINARLIAAAPELLAALQALFAWSVAQPFREHDGHPVQLARAAIARATGASE